MPNQFSKYLDSNAARGSVLDDEGCKRTKRRHGYGFCELGEQAESLTKRFLKLVYGGKGAGVTWPKGR